MHCMRIHINSNAYDIASAAVATAAIGCILQIEIIFLLSLSPSFFTSQVYLTELPVEILFTLSGGREWKTSNKIML